MTYKAGTVKEARTKDDTGWVPPRRPTDNECVIFNRHVHAHCQLLAGFFPHHHISVCLKMPPTRSDTPRQRHTKTETTSHILGSRRVHARASQQIAQTIELSDNEDTPSDVIVISDDENGSSSRSVAKHSSHSRPNRIYKGRRTALDAHTATIAPLRPATLTNLRAGVFGDPKTWTFGLPERNHISKEDLWVEIRDSPTLFLQFSEREKAKHLEMVRESIDHMDSKAFGVSLLT